MKDKTPTPLTKPVLLKISGEILGEAKKLANLLQEIGSLSNRFTFVLITGGGNLFRGRSSPFSKTAAPFSDSIGMCASLLNALTLHAEMQEFGLLSSVFGSFSVPSGARLFSEAHAKKALKAGQHVIIGGGIGQPFVTTDTAAILYAMRLGCRLILKGTKFKGVFDRDPEQDKNAIFLPYLSHQELRQRGLEPMDKAALALAETYKVPLRIFSLASPGSLGQVLKGVQPFTAIGDRKIDV